MTLPEKSVLGHYEIVSLLGKGGMGEVYLAQDQKLHRRVAIKLLATEYAADNERLRRFEQEAYAISALSHHGLVTIYEIGRKDSIPFIVMEYIEGQTLRQRLKQRGLSVPEVLDIATQVVEALAATHVGGIIHRDIKPENIMLREDGYVKVLDFGLAKLNEVRLQAQATPDASTMTNINTGQGAAIGTAVYMSPEQLRGQAIDGRTDLWSIGVVLYEMLTVTIPFKGHTTGEVIVSILEREPEPLVHRLPEVPLGLQRIITKALQKNRNERYQTANEMLADLRQFHRQLHTAAVVQAGNDFRDATQHVTLPGYPSPPVTVMKDGTLSTAEQNTTTVERSAEVKVQQDTPAPKFQSWPRYALVLSILSLMSILGYVGYRFYPGRAKQVSPAQVTSLTAKHRRIAIPGKVRDAIISPDGAYVASVVEEGSGQSLHVMEMATSKDIKVAGPSDKGYTGLTFSPDGTFIYYLENEPETATLYRISKLGGGQRRLLSDVNTAVSFSPDGARIAFVRYDNKEESTVLVIADADGTNEKRFVTRKPPEYFAVSADLAGPVWSPNGEVIACPTVNRASGITQMNVEAINVRDGSARRLNAAPWHEITKLLWVKDGSGLVIDCSESLMEPWQLSLLSYPGGEVSKITNDANYYVKVSMTGDSSTLLAVMADIESSIWIVNAVDTAQVKSLRADGNEGINGVTSLPDGRLVYSSRYGGESFNIWIRDANGTDQKQLTFGSDVNSQPIVSPDGRYIVFVSSRSGAFNIWRINIDGTQPLRLTKGDYEDSPQVMPDGRWVVYRTRDALWKVPIDGREPVLLTKKNTLHPVVSPDGKLLAYYVLDVSTGADWKLELSSMDDLSTIKQFSLPTYVSPTAGLRWTRDGSGLTYVSTAGGAANIWVQPLDGSAPKQLTNFRDSQIFSFSWSADGKEIASARGVQTFKAVLIKNFLQRPGA